MSKSKHKHSNRNVPQTQIKATPRKPSLIDITYPVYGQFESLAQSIRFLNEATDGLEYRIWFADDASPDLEPTGKAFYNDIKNNPNYGGVTYHKQNTGFAKSSNDAVSLGTSKYIMFMSTDIIMTPSSIKLAIEHMDANPDIGMIGPKLLFYPNSTDGRRPAGKVQCVGIFFDVLGKPYHPFSAWDADNAMVNIVRDVDATTGAAFLIRRSTWNQLKGFSLDYGRGYFEDVDLCIRLRMLGFKIRILPQMVAYHYTNLSFEHSTTGLSMQRNENVLRGKFENVIPYDDWFLTYPPSDE